MMVEIYEIITLVLGTAGLLFIGASKQQLRKIPFFNLIFFSYIILIVSWLLTVLESFFWGNLLNLLEHLGYLSCSFLLAIWCWKIGLKSTGPLKK
jgi:hypothetical protein